MIFNGAIEAAKEEGLRIATGTYKGTGKNDESNPNEIVLPFSPKFLFVEASRMSSGRISSGGFLIGVPSSGVLYVMVISSTPLLGNMTSSNTRHGAISCTLQDNVLQWHSGDAISQLNVSDQTYTWIAIG